MKSLHIALLALISITGSATFASGSFSLPGGGDQQAYNLGKKAVHQKVICDTCPMSHLTLNKANAKSIAMAVSESSSNDLKLSEDEQSAATAYLIKRFGL